MTSTLALSIACLALARTYQSNSFLFWIWLIASIVHGTIYLTIYLIEVMNDN